MTSKSYMWVFCGVEGGRGRRIILYKYHRSRSGEVAAGMLKGYQGYVQTDGYSGYGFLDKREGIVHVGCWAHVRRKFAEVLKVIGKNKGDGDRDRDRDRDGRAENAIRPFVVGRKNWLFSYNEDGASASAFFYSIIETAKANGIEPYKYLRYLFERLPQAKTKDDYRRLLPQNIDRDIFLKAVNTS